MLRALIWDVDGTIAETERDGHRVAFNRAFEHEGVSWRWDVATYGDRLKVAGGLERLLHDMDGRADAPATPAARSDLASRLHVRKNAFYADIVATGRIGLRPGVARLMDECARDGIAQAIATTTSRANVTALLKASLPGDWESRFAAMVCADDAPKKKPDPQAYRKVLDDLRLDASEVIAIEDSPNGLAASCGAGIATLVTRSSYFRDGRFDEAIALCDDLDSPVVWDGGGAARVDAGALHSVLAIDRKRRLAD